MMSKLLRGVSIVGLSILALFLFFGGTWEGVQFGLQLLGAVFVLQTTYEALSDS